VLAATRKTQRMSERANCPRGHPYSGGNLVEELRMRAGRSFVARRCRQCRRAQTRERMRRRLGITPDRFRVV
jgi:hypothetical protein